MIHLEGISKVFDAGKRAIHAVNDVSLDISTGEIYGIIGFSGAGKSTLVRCINLLERPTTGTVTVDGVDLTALGEQQLRKERRKIGMIFQHFNLLRSRTVYQNIAFPLKKSNLDKEEKDKKILDLLELVGLSDKKDAYPSQLSGGQKQRVAIARALANDPKVLLCDEATSALDPQTTHSILTLLKQVNEKLGITIVIITHEMAVVKDICHKVAIMENGIVVEKGETAQIFANPQQALTKSFMDSASNIHKIYDLLDQDHPMTQVKAGEKLVLLTYARNDASTPLISYLASQFNVNASIIYGNVEVLQGQPVGKLIVLLSGEQVSAAMDYIQSQQVQMEVLKG